ncbi:TetR/AcrR family transcriptional regulator [Enterobacter sp. R1(2018)]|uniref:TetR/AcrR family transcriptional regulator n=1 Tax=Enterobacter sp. R1(2018) TaxID=2447891 RepID=UPI000EB2DC25|nr:TetR family transcriptional regulator [Enterobacter sp. R1(2018)]RKQ39642.1 TetR family transcriptional regulator [Enterobacter sp. R1(2018)]
MSKAPRRNDPDRRARILQATLDMLVEHGVSHITHRKIAEAAGVSLGSMTYYFDGIDSLLSEAFTQFALGMSESYRARLEGAKNAEEACEVIVDMICGEEIATSYNLQVMYQLYAYANRTPPLKTIMQDWMKRSQQALEAFFDPITARTLDAFIEGMTLHYVTDREPMSREDLTRMVAKIVR